MQISHDPKADALSARFAPEGAQIETTREIAAGVTMDLDSVGQLVGIEVLGVGARAEGTHRRGDLREQAA